MLALADPPTPAPAPLAFRRGRIAEIEYLRGIAILMVLVEHLPFNLLFWLSPTFLFLRDYGRGWMGVDLFFAISGFVITRSVLPGIQALPRASWVPFCVDFYRRRAWRLLPSAWLWLALIMIGCMFYNRFHGFQSVRSNVESCIASLLNLQNFHIAEVLDHGDPGLAFPYWSLSLEEQFYFILPIALLVLRSAIMVPLVVMLLTSLLHQSPIVNMTRTSGFACGVFLGWAFHCWPIAMRQLRPDGLARNRLARITLSVMTLGLLLVLGTPRFHIVAFPMLPITLLCAVLVWIAAYDDGLLCRRGPFRGAIEWVGSRSYSLYVAHVPVFAAVHETYLRLASSPLAHPRPLWAYILVGLAACVLVADANYRLVEVPLRRRGHPERLSRTAAQGEALEAAAFQKTFAEG